MGTYSITQVKYYKRENYREIDLFSAIPKNMFCHRRPHNTIVLYNCAHINNKSTDNEVNITTLAQPEFLIGPNQKFWLRQCGVL